jgi:fimbrial isopeptide formation D2 family protein/LPXTG-motif cell wall-anchored protein
MKKLKKLAVLLLAVVMTMAMNMTVFADGEATGDTATAKGYTLTLNGTTTGHIYEAYQIFTGDLSSENNNMVLSNVKWGTGVTYTGAESAADVAKALGDKKMSIADLEDKLTLTKPVKTVESSKDSTVIDGLAAGYYLVKDQDGTQAGKSDAYTKFIIQVVGNATADVKSGVPTVEKKVMDKNDSMGKTSDWQDSADYDIEDDVPFQITGTMPSNIDAYTTYKYVFTDTMSKGLTYTANNAKIKIGEKDVTSSFTETMTTDADGKTVVTWSCGNLKGIDGVTLNKDTKVVVTYSAKLNKDAVIGSAGNPNEVNLTYSNNPNKGGDGETGKTPDDKNIVFTYKVVVNKVDQDKKSLAGAAFKLEKKSDGTYATVKEFTAGTETSFEFSGLDDGDYRLTETTTPSGYNTIDPVEFTISATHDTESNDPKLTELSVTGAKGFTADKDAGSLTTDIVNKKGSNLPSTGGIGTRMFYVFGGCLVAAAAVLLALKKRREA